MPITLLDGILLVIMLVSAFLAMIRGFSREVLSILSWVAAAVAAVLFFRALSPFVMDMIGARISNNQLVADAIAGIAIFLLVLIVVSYLTMLLADMIIDSRVGALDRTLGFIFGAVRGFLLVTVLLMGFLWLANEQEPEWVANAKSKPMIEAVGTGIRDALPENLDQLVREKLGQGEDEPKEGEQDAEQAN